MSENQKGPIGEQNDDDITIVENRNDVKTKEDGRYELRNRVKTKQSIITIKVKT